MRPGVGSILLQRSNGADQTMDSMCIETTYNWSSISSTRRLPSPLPELNLIQNSMAPLSAAAAAPAAALAAAGARTSSWVNGSRIIPMAPAVQARKKAWKCAGVACSAKAETVAKVVEIVKKQLALPEETAVTAASKFTEMGADSLDTVEIVMALEEEFDISVEEDNAQNISTVQDAADLIDKLVGQKPAAAAAGDA